MINLKPVESSMIKQVGFDEESEVLRVVFNNNATYDYADVPKVEHDALMEADSIGKHFHRNIRGKFVTTKAK